MIFCLEKSLRAQLAIERKTLRPDDKKSQRDAPMTDKMTELSVGPINPEIIRYRSIASTTYYYR